MLPLTGKNMVVIGGSRGVGRRIVESDVLNGARVLAVARQEAPLQQLAKEVPDVEVLSKGSPPVKHKPHITSHNLFYGT